MSTLLRSTSNEQLRALDDHILGIIGANNQRRSTQPTTIMG